ncbi:MAG: potassium channel protein [Deltaproteobacteria bacterium]|nr:potassium channel protein [Deltaproteobacteria bacterium]MBW2339721.1 potassium channel protein [Deltaproteobacteria bacterium]
MNVPRKLLFPIIIFLILLLSGIFGYMYLEGWDLLDSLYMTIITLSTVGYGEVREIGPGGRVFTVLLIIFGVSIITYTVSLVVETLIAGEIRSVLGRRKVSKKIKSLRDHYIICGYGRIGSIICKGLTRKAIPLMVIEKDEQVLEELEQDKTLCLQGDAAHEETLVEAGIEKAKGLVSVVSSDAENVYICLTARGLNPRLYILSRAEDEASERKLLRAGANKVILPYMLGGRRMVQAIIRPTVSDFLESAVHDQSFELAIEELTVGADSSLVNQSLVDSDIRQEMDIIIIGIKQKAGTMIFNPSSQTKIQSDDILIAMGRDKDLERLRRVLTPSVNTVSV